MHARHTKTKDSPLLFAFSPSLFPLFSLLVTCPRISVRWNKRKLNIFWTSKSCGLIANRHPAELSPTYLVRCTEIYNWPLRETCMQIPMNIKTKEMFNLKQEHICFQSDLSVSHAGRRGNHISRN